MNESSKQTCNDARLRTLIRCDEDSVQFRRAAGHVEECVSCQRRLSELAADADSWSEAGELLAAHERFAMTDENTTPHDKPSDHIVREFLDTPSHPEMLGRLGRYEVEGVIGSGGMGIVLKAHDSELNRPVAVKVLAPHLAHCGAARQRFAREGRAAAAVMHEHVVAVHNVESDARVPYLVMQYVPGCSLQTRVDREGPLDAKEVLRIGLQAASGLAAAHAQGLVHRDVKPANLLLENNVERALLTDFGLARVVDDATLTQTGVVAGTPHYMSPEQADGRPVDHRSDLFSLGSVLYFAATGRPPFRADRPIAVLRAICDKPHRPVWEVNSDQPDAVCDVIDRLLEKRPNDRFADAMRVDQALSRALAELQQTARRQTPLRRWLRRDRRRLLFAGASIVLCVAVSSVAFFADWWRQDSSGVPVASELREAGPIERITVIPPIADIVPGNSLVDSMSDEVDLLADEVTDIQLNQTATDFLHLNDNEWRNEVQSLNQKLTELESRQDSR